MRRITRAAFLAVPLLIGTAVVPNAFVPQAQAGHWHGGYGPGPHWGGPGPGYGGGPGWRGGHHGHGGAVVGGLLGGLALGMVGGAMLAQSAPPPVTYVQPPVVYAPPPPPVRYIQPPPVAVYPSYPAYPGYLDIEQSAFLRLP